MRVAILENRTGETVKFRRFALSGLGGTQSELTDALDVTPGYNAVPGDAAEVPPYFGSDADRPMGVPRESMVSVDDYFRDSRVVLMIGDEMLWSYSDFDGSGSLIRSPGADLGRRGDLTSREALEVVGGHGEAIALRKISFTRDQITQALVTKEEMDRIGIDLIAKLNAG